MAGLIVTVDVVLLTLQGGQLQVALLRRENEPYQGVWALPGGFLRPAEDADAAAAATRILATKTGLVSPYLEHLATFSGAARDPRGWSVSIAWYALVAPEVLVATMPPTVQLAPVRPALKLPFDHRVILDTALARVRNKSQYSSLPCFLAGEQFTLPKLQAVYEAVLGEPLNKVSFRRKMAELDVLEPVAGAQETTGAHRPAQLYRLKPGYREELMLLRRGL